MREPSRAIEQPVARAVEVILLNLGHFDPAAISLAISFEWRRGTPTE
jgi:hypothetical protein